MAAPSIQPSGSAEHDPPVVRMRASDFRVDGVGTGASKTETDGAERAGDEPVEVNIEEVFKGGGMTVAEIELKGWATLELGFGVSSDARWRKRYHVSPVLRVPHRITVGKIHRSRRKLGQREGLELTTTFAQPNERLSALEVLCGTTLLGATEEVLLEINVRANTLHVRPERAHGIQSRTQWEKFCACTPAKATARKARAAMSENSIVDERMGVG
ncbi:hypothetical protein V8D89_008615 [Ganoderma adspersum]